MNSYDSQLIIIKLKKMGNPASKFFKTQKSEIVLTEIHKTEPEIPSTPTQSISIDPRSPSIEIVRTPIEKGYLEEHPHEFNTHTPYAKPELDPRSPTIEITRTPIVIQNPVVQIKTSDDIRKKLLKGNTIKKLTQSTEDILAASSRQGVLETDLDFIETDIDLVYQRNTIKYLQDTPLNIETNYFALEDPRSPSYGIDRTPIQIPNAEQDPRSPSIEFTRTPIVLESSFEEKLDSLKLEEDVVDTLLVEVTPKVKKGLIYEDGDSEQVVTPSRKVNNDGRTPLGVRNGSQARSKSANGRLLQNYEVGKIPIYNKNIKKMKVKKVQCENTPPKQGLKRRGGSAHQWDATDNTLII